MLNDLLVPLEICNKIRSKISIRIWTQWGLPYSRTTIIDL